VEFIVSFVVAAMVLLYILKSTRCNKNYFFFFSNSCLHTLLIQVSKLSGALSSHIHVYM